MSASRWSSQPWQYAAVSAGIAAVIGLVAAPWLTLQALFVLVAAGFLVVGVRSLVREQRAGKTDPAADLPACVCGDPCPTPETHNWGCRCDRRQRALGYREAAERLHDLGYNRAADHLDGWANSLDQQRPDGSGSCPDPIRKTPDTTGQRAADQAGHNPEALRTAANESITRALAANPDIAAEYQRIRLMLQASRDDRGTLMQQLAEATDALDATNAAVVTAQACGEDGLCPICADGGGHLADIARALRAVPPAEGSSR